MENFNLPPFVKGDKVVFIGDSVLKKGTIYIVDSLRKQVCGCCWVVNVKGVIHFPSHLSTTCVHCKKMVNGFLHLGIHRICGEPFSVALDHHEFRKVQESKFRAVSFEKIMEETEKICVN